MRSLTIAVLSTLFALSLMAACDNGRGKVSADPDTVPPQDNSPAPDATADADKSPRVVLDTSMGKITLELDAEKAPISVKNFLKYVDDGHYDGTVFHRVIDDFMVQGGGFTKDLKEKDTRGPIQNEATNGLKNNLGTVAMARTPDPHSATAQFFINVKDNDFLNHQNTTQRGYGYCVFGKVVDGMDVVNKVKKVKTHTTTAQTDRGPAPFQDVPVEPIVIKSAKRVKTGD